jgi:hypothetical protein
MASITLPDGRVFEVVRSRNAAHRQQRWEKVLLKIAALDEPAKSECIGYALGLLDGLRAARIDAQE